MNFLYSEEKTLCPTMTLFIKAVVNMEDKHPLKHGTLYL